MGGLAIGIGAGSATNEQFAQGMAVMALTLASPFVVAAVLGLEGALLLARKRGKIIIAVGYSPSPRSSPFIRFSSKVSTPPT